MLSDTELRLSFWRDGSTKAERLAAAVLRLSGYQEIDPQSPLGGPDGKKDLICTKGGVTWIGAVYFPIGPVGFPSIKRKFTSDLTGATAGFGGFVFITNQSLFPTQRKSLASIGQKLGKEVAILHLQQLQTLLDSPLGYGIRIQFLGIGMTIEEQLSWAVDSDSQTAKALSANTRELLALRAAIERLNAGQAHIMRTMSDFPVAPQSGPDLISVSTFLQSPGSGQITRELQPALVTLFHRLTCFDLPSRSIGAIREADVWIGNLDGQRADHVQPPPAEEVMAKLVSLCSRWREEFSNLRSKEAKLEAVARFHSEFLVIHPFTDGNGRVARAILMQQCLDLFGKADMTLMNKGAAYYEALKQGDLGRYGALVDLIGPVVES